LVNWTTRDENVRDHDLRADLHHSRRFGAQCKKGNGGAATPARNVVRHTVDKHIGSALILEDGKLLGIFTAMDACRVLAESLE
jgi:hypothetical protein